MMQTKQWLAGLAMVCSLSAGGAMAAPEDDYKEGLLAQGKDDLQTAMVLFKRAADAGHPLAMVAFGTILDLAEENEAALEWLRKAADAGEVAGMDRLGVMLLNGEGGKNREKEGLAWIEKAAGLNHGPSMVVLAKILFSGKSGVGVDGERGLKLLTSAAESGFIPAIKELVRIHRVGEAGVPPDPAAAQFWEAKLPKSVDHRPKTGKRSGGDKP
ncbi:MAG: sel1 repeat family protein [Magnetococcales bacterium]|nr:sel1 repeat family protein [Magnetococcales bacterium]